MLTPSKLRQRWRKDGYTEDVQKRWRAIVSRSWVQGRDGRTVAGIEPCKVLQALLLPPLLKPVFIPFLHWFSHFLDPSL